MTRSLERPRLRSICAGALALLAALLFPPADVRADTIWTVTSAADTGGSCVPTSCSLRAAITAANASAGADTIVFSIQPPGRYRIAVNTQLPDITGTVSLDASTQPGGGTYPIWLDDADGGGGESGLVVAASGVHIRGFAITHFDRFGIFLRQATGAAIQGNLIGTRDGFADDGTVDDGIRITGGGNHLIGGTSVSDRNIVSGGGGEGLEFEDSSDNVIVGNYIGTTADGLGRLPNIGGLEMNGLSFRNRVGGTSPAERNVISGNDGIGVQILGALNPDGSCEPPADNVVLGNYLGPNVNGLRMTPYGNTGEGAQISTCATRNTIGGTSVGARNIISGNRADGVEIDASGGPKGLAGVCGNTVQGNYIGTDPTGTIAVQNVDDGIGIDNAACETLVGGAVPGAGNLISGNFNDGIDINRLGSDRNRVVGNVIGLASDGSTVLRNTQSGVNIRFKAQSNVIENNVISANVRSGVTVEGNLTDHNIIRNNLIGTSASGAAIRGNKEYGILLTDGPKSNTIEGNTIKGSGFDGVAVEKLASSSLTTYANTITRNAISANTGLGIDLLPPDGVDPIDGATTTESGNRGIDRPVIAEATTTSVRGTAMPGATVEVFRATPGAGETSGEGSTFLGSTQAGPAGSWCLGGLASVSGPVTATATVSSSTSEFAANLNASGTTDVCAGTPPEPIVLFRDEFTGPDGSTPADWEVRRSASGPGAGATISSNRFALDVVLSPDQTTTQYVQARETAVQGDWSGNLTSFSWQMSTDADVNQAASLVLAPSIRTGNVLSGTDYLRVRIQNGRAAIVSVTGGTATTLWSGPIVASTQLSDLELRIDAAHVELLNGPAGSRTSLSGSLSHGLGWTQGWAYLHASTNQQVPFHAVFDAFQISRPG